MSARRVWWWAWEGPPSIQTVVARWLVCLVLFLAVMVAVGVLGLAVETAREVLRWT